MKSKYNFNASHQEKRRERYGRRGFTVLELTIVISLIAILAAILIPARSSITKNTSETVALAEAKAQYARYLESHIGDEHFYIPRGIRIRDSYFAVIDGEVKRAESPEPSAVAAADCNEHEDCKSILFDAVTADRITAERGKDAAILLYTEFRAAHPMLHLPVSVFILIDNWYYEFDTEGAFMGLLTAAEGDARFLTHKADCTDGAHAACAFVYLEGEHENPYE